MALAQPGVTAQANLAALEKILIGEDTRNADLIREAMSGGAQRRAGIRALGRLEQPELIRWVAPALGDGVGIRAEAAWALAQLARTAVQSEINGADVMAWHLYLGVFFVLLVMFAPGGLSSLLLLNLRVARFGRFRRLRDPYVGVLGTGVALAAGIAC